MAHIDSQETHCVEDKHLDVLQNIEFAIVQVYQERPDLIDAEVMTELNH
ncbi:hypothetical protein [Fischerella sp. PCC 9605]|nr:hypothetical protein [Fischerella sp. PCC 9605]